MYLPPGFNNPTALECAELVTQAYTQFEKFKQGHEQDWHLEGDYDKLAVLHAKPEDLFEHVEPFGFVARNRTSGNVFVSIRGTASIEDWLSDFSLPQVGHPWGRAEEGFTHLYEQCSEALKTGVQDGAGAPNVFVTGHSLGAALATLATADLVISGVNPKSAMYTLAGPRVGNPDFARKFNNAVDVKWRIVNTEDIVTTVPLATPVLFPDSHPHSAFGIMLMLARKLDYEHVGDPVSFTAHRGSISDNHRMPIYLEALKNPECSS